MTSFINSDMPFLKIDIPLQLIFEYDVNNDNIFPYPSSYNLLQIIQIQVDNVVDATSKTYTLRKNLLLNLS